LAEPPAAAPARPPAAAPERRPPAALGLAPAPRSGERAAAEADQQGADRLAKARPVQRTAPIDDSAVEDDPARWLERIVALREAGRDEEADRELARLRERYRDVTVPPAALRRTGTR
jgi:hypothetical protein